MTTKDYLRRAFEIDRRLQIKYRRLNVMESRAEGSYYREEGEGHHADYVRSRMEECAIKVIELKELIADDENLLKDVRNQIKQAIRSTGNELYVTVLEMRYLQYMSWDEICSQMGYGKTNVFRLHGEALESVVLPPAVE